MSKKRRTVAKQFRGWNVVVVLNVFKWKSVDDDADVDGGGTCQKNWDKNIFEQKPGFDPMPPLPEILMDDLSSQN